MNRLLDHELLRALYLPWGCFRFNLDGYLHWGFNRFTPEVTPFLPSIGGNLPPGDTHIVYPGDKDSGPWPSVRLEAMRQGMEDYELLRLLAKDRPDRARAILRRLVRGFGDYTADVPLYRKTRRELLMCVGRKEATK
jgi:hypothetical protein